MFVNEQEDYKVISSSILLGAIASGDSLNLKPFLVAEMVNYFLEYDPNVSVTNSMTNLFSLSNYPNPFTSETRINYTIQSSEKVSIAVYNSMGQVVKQLVDKNLTSGNYSTSWNGTDSKGNKVKNGLYFYKINVGGFTQTEKMILLH